MKITPQRGWGQMAGIGNPLENFTNLRISFGDILGSLPSLVSSWPSPQ
jgi:hypothetical protein